MQVIINSTNFWTREPAGTRRRTFSRGRAPVRGMLQAQSVVVDPPSPPSGSPSRLRLQAEVVEEASATGSASSAALQEMVSLLAARGVVPRVRPDGEPVEQTLSRYLRAEKGHPLRAADKYAETCAWRKREAVDALRQMSPAAILGCDPSEVARFLPHFQGGHDRGGRPLIFKHFGGQCVVKQMLRHTSLEAIGR